MLASQERPRFGDSLPATRNAPVGGSARPVGAPGITDWSPAGGSIEIIDESSTNGTLWTHHHNNGTSYVYFQPTAIVAPSRY